MRKLVVIIAAYVLLWVACSQEKSGNQGLVEKSVTEIRNESTVKNSDIIRNPVSADGPIDTINVARMDFEETSHNFGTVKEGAKLEHIFKFTNTGKIPLVINDARSTCGCTVPSWPKAPIAAGASGEIKVKFNTDGKKNRQNKPVTITANTYPQKTVIYMQGEVTPKNN